MSGVQGVRYVIFLYAPQATRISYDGLSNAMPSKLTLGFMAMGFASQPILP